MAEEMKIADKTLLAAFNSLPKEGQAALAAMLVTAQGYEVEELRRLNAESLRKVKRRLKRSAREKGRRS